MSPPAANARLLNGAGTIISSELAARAELDKSAMSKAIVRLVKKSLVTRLPRAGDRRCFELALTPKGRRLYEQILPVVQEVNRDLLDGLLERIQQRAAAMQEGAGSLPLADRRRGDSGRRV